MSLSRIVALYIGLASVVSLAKIVDLSHKHRPNSFMSPGSAQYERTLIFAGEIQPGIYVETANLYTGEHGGTHIDVPSHFFNGGRTVDQIPIHNLILDGVMIDCSNDVNGDPTYVLSERKIMEWESQNGMIPDGAGVVINFGWSSRYSNPSEYVQSSNFSSFAFFTYPTLSEDAASYLVNERKAKLVAVDTASPDFPNYPNHVIILGKGATIVENVRDPGRLPARNFRLHAVPVAFEGASGTPTRFYAITDDDDYFSRYSGGVSSLMQSMLNIGLSLFFIAFFKCID